MDVPGLDDLVSPQGWPYASSAPVDADDRGRYHCLFGRDSMVTALQVLPARPDVAVATLRALAERQGGVADTATGEEPGKIGHEFRDEAPADWVARGWPPGGPFRYYGSADATSWFLVLLDATVAATGDRRLAGELEPAWRAADGWLERTLDAGDGLVRHRPGSQPGGLVQQGWRDTLDPLAGDGGGIVRPDGTVPEPPLADADTQAVTVAALRAVARLSGEPGRRERVEAMRSLVTQRFRPDVMALEAGDRPVSGAGSQLGWLLWADALEPDAAAAAAERLCAPDVLTGFGLRTLSSDAPTFEPRSYHRGSVWPFDCWLGWGGLRAAGRTAEAERVRTGVLDAVARLGLYPELYGVTSDGALEALPVSNRVQAWTVGAAWALGQGWDGRPAR